MVSATWLHCSLIGSPLLEHFSFKVGQSQICLSVSFTVVCLSLGNEIATVNGLDGLVQLTELVLDRNKIKVLEYILFWFRGKHYLEFCICSQSLQQASLTSLGSLRELHIEENRLKDLSHFSPLLNLERLYLGMNRIQVHKFYSLYFVSS